MIWTVPGAGWFHHELVPDGAPSGLLDDRTTMAVWQLGNCICCYLSVIDDPLTVMIVRLLPAQFAGRSWPESRA